MFPETWQTGARWAIAYRAAEAPPNWTILHAQQDLDAACADAREFRRLYIGTITAYAVYDPAGRKRREWQRAQEG